MTPCTAIPRRQYFSLVRHSPQPVICAMKVNESDLLQLMTLLSPSSPPLLFQAFFVFASAPPHFFFMSVHCSSQLLRGCVFQEDSFFTSFFDSVSPSYPASSTGPSLRSAMLELFL